MTAIGLIFCLATGMSLQAAATSSKDSKTAGSTESSEDDKAHNTSLKDAQKEKDALEAALKRVKNTIKELKESKGDVEARVAELNRQLIDISSRITELENALTQKGEEIVDAQEQLELARQRESRQYEDMKVRIQFMYEKGADSYLEALLSARNISDFMNMAEYITQIQKYDRQKLDEYEATVEAIANMEAQLEQDYADLEVLKATVEEEKASVAAMMRQKETELASISEDISDAQDDADYYAAEIQAQNELIAQIKRIEAEKRAAGIVDNPYTGGPFTWPCPSSTRVTSDYGNRVSPTAGASSNHKGIDIGAAQGADIIAAADGTVKAATYSSAAGNYVMIDHGGGLYTVYMHASSLNVSVGQVVSAGQVIAKVGSTGISTASHLHFGVSLNGSYVSPWSYLTG